MPVFLSVALSDDISRDLFPSLVLRQGTLAIVDNHAWLMEGTEDGITLAIKPNGITCTLSKFLPQYIAKNIAFFADGFLKKNNLSRDDGKREKRKKN